MKAKTGTTPHTEHLMPYLVGLVVSVAICGLGAFIAARKQVMGWELSFFPLVNGWPDSMLYPMHAITFLGSAWMAALSVAAAFFVRYYALACRLAISILAGYALTALLKYGVDRERPDGLADGVIETVHFRAVEIAMGYPSAHAAIATIIVLTLVPYLRWRWRWIVPLVIAAVGLSRIYVGVHLPLDIIGGITLGIAVVASVRLLPRPLRVALRIN